MPELPEVETVLRTLESRIKDKKILACRIISRQIINGDAEEFRKRIIGETFRSFKRRGKYLLFIMDDLIMVSHLRMEGKYFIQKRRCGLNPGPNEVINRRRSHTCIPMKIAYAQ